MKLFFEKRNSAYGRVTLSESGQALFEFMLLSPFIIGIFLLSIELILGVISFVIIDEEAYEFLVCKRYAPDSGFATISVKNSDSKCVKNFNKSINIPLGQWDWKMMNQNQIQLNLKLPALSAIQWNKSRVD